MTRFLKRIAVCVVAFLFLLQQQSFAADKYDCGYVELTTNSAGISFSQTTAYHPGNRAKEIVVSGSVAAGANVSVVQFNPESYFSGTRKIDHEIAIEDNLPSSGYRMFVDLYSFTNIGFMVSDSSAGNTSVKIQKVIFENGDVYYYGQCGPIEQPPDPDPEDPPKDPAPSPSPCCTCPAPPPPPPPPEPIPPAPEDLPPDPDFSSPAGDKPKIELNPIPGDGMVRYEHKQFPQGHIGSPAKLPKAPGLLSGRPAHDPAGVSDAPKSKQSPLNSQAAKSPSSSLMSEQPISQTVLQPQASIPKSVVTPQSPRSQTLPHIQNPGLADTALSPQAPLQPKGVGDD